MTDDATTLLVLAHFLLSSLSEPSSISASSLETNSQSEDVDKCFANGGKITSNEPMAFARVLLSNDVLVRGK